MEKITEVGLLLRNDSCKSATDNLFRQLFGRWPTSKGLSEKRTAQLLELIDSIKICDQKVGDCVCQFFKFDQKQSSDSENDTVSIISDDTLTQIDNVLHILRSQYALDILCIYSEDIGIDMYDLVKENRELKARVHNLRERLHEVEYELKKCTEAEASTNDEQEKLLDHPITELHLSDDIRKILWGHNIQSIRELTSRTSYGIRELNDMTDEGFVEVANALALIGLNFYPRKEE